VLDHARIDDRDRLEPSVRVLSDAEALLGRRKLVRTRVVKKQERVENRAEVRVGEQGADGKPITYPVAVGASLNAPQLLVRPVALNASTSFL
jgi:hypothetical protein